MLNKINKYFKKIQYYNKQLQGGSNDNLCKLSFAHIMNDIITEIYIEYYKEIINNFYKKEGVIKEDDRLNKFIESYNKYNVNFNFMLIIGVTNLTTIDPRRNNHDDLNRFKDIPAIVINKDFNISYDNPNQIGFKLDINNDKILKLLKDNFKNNFLLILFDYSTTKFIDITKLPILDILHKEKGICIIEAMVMSEKISNEIPNYNEITTQILNGTYDFTSFNIYIAIILEMMFSDKSFEKRIIKLNILQHTIDKLLTYNTNATQQITLNNITVCNGTYPVPSYVNNFPGISNYNEINNTDYIIIHH